MAPGPEVACRPDLAGQLGVCLGLEGRELLVADLDELDSVPDLVEDTHEAVDAVAGVAVDAVDAPGVEAAEHVGGNGLEGHGQAPFGDRASRRV